MIKKRSTADSIEFGILTDESVSYAYNSDVIDRLFFNNLDYSHKFIYDDTLTLEDGSRINGSDFYKVNSKFYRGKDFVDSPEIIVSGCSFTYGAGLSENNMWPSMLSELMGMQHINLALPGKSVTSIINNLYSYFREYGHPKYIFCLFPSFGRFELPINKDLILSVRNTSPDTYNGSPMFFGEPIESGGYVQDIIIRDDILSEKPIYSKKPHVFEDIISLDLPYWTAIKAILSFEQYCSVAGIKFLWATYEEDMESAIHIIKDRHKDHYTSFIEMGTGYLNDCHQDYKENNSYIWEWALDRDRGLEHAHPGLHFNIHVTEAFSKALGIDEI
jgi:hypothetical protein